MTCIDCVYFAGILLLPGSSLNTVRENITQQCINSLYVYRKHCASSTQAGQLILPESLKLFPLYTLALLKRCWASSHYPPFAVPLYHRAPCLSCSRRPSWPLNQCLCLSCSRRPSWLPNQCLRPSLSDTACVQRSLPRIRRCAC